MLLRRVFISLLLIACAAASVRAFPDAPLNEELVVLYLPYHTGNLTAIQAGRRLTTEYDEFAPLQNTPVKDAVARMYRSSNGRFDVRLFVTDSESGAYALLTGFRDSLIRQGQAPADPHLGTPAYSFPDQIVMAKGKLLLHIVPLTRPRNDTALSDVASVFAEDLPRAEGEIPVLVKHLPKWEAEPREVSYFVTLEALKDAIPSPAFDGLTYDGSEAVLTNYGSAQFVLIEFPTPQLATQNDQQVLVKLQELRTQNQPLPTLYRRVGNYAVFVFGGDEVAAKALADEVKYEQVTKWLGENPYPLLEAQRRYTATTLGVLVSVVKASGLALVVCLTAGGLFGGLLFLRRRAQQRTVAAYSDAGGMLRLNLDEMTPQTDPAKLLQE